ncbi:dystroglycan-like [Dorcoceras hygrometricum]|uniref:Dystroglycan-like n=1 Tax=Dorcoceras hygrometricum TaxID=472368 RepID=A0A2Z7B734_9LAMI|nr:dystroglycan-like [Dorcoceras hygrometricum]
MASSFYSNSQHVDFDSVLAMDDQGMVSMFQGIMASGLAGFLGCPAVIYEAALVDFFENASVREGVIISTVDGQLVEISEEWFAESFELPVDGLGDLSEIPKDVIFDARSIVSLSGEPVSLSGRKNQMKIEFRLLCDIMAKDISVKAGSFNAITVEKFSLVTAVFCRVRMNWARILFSTLKKMVTPGSKQAKGFAVQISLLLENIPNLELGESLEFPASKILTAKTVHRYISINDKVGGEETADAPQVKKTPKTPAVSKKRPAAAAAAEYQVLKKKRTLKKKSVTSHSTLEMVAVAQEAVPIQMVESSAGVPTADQPAAVDAFPADRPAEEIEILENRRKHFVPSKESSAVELKIFNKLSSFHRLVLEELKTDTLAHRLVWKQPCCSGIFEGKLFRVKSIASANMMTLSLRSSSLHFDTTDLDATVSSLPPVSIDLSAALADFQAILSEQINESQNGISSRLHKIEQGLRDSLREQAEVFKNLFQGARQEGRTIDDVQTLRFNEFRKNILAQNASIFTGLADVRKEVQEAQENQNLLHAQLSELVNYINRGSADKKGEGSSRPLPTPVRVERRPLPTPQPPSDDQGSGQFLSVEQAVELVREADRRESDRLERERSRERRERRLSRSGSYKR